MLNKNLEYCIDDAWDRAIDRKASALRVLGPLGFEDADDDELPGAI